MVFIGSCQLKEKRHMIIAIDVEKLFNTTLAFIHAKYS